ncbi:MAG TPA: class I SAM-dependent RNA methyltransferase [Bryobacteraceae bacterium]
MITPTESTVTVERWVYGGEGLARVDGKVVFAPFALPGERVRIARRDAMHADLAEVLEPSPERVAPPCPLFTKCGGCHYQHAPYEFQVARKAEILREQLKRVGKIDYSGEIATVSGPALHYRNRVQLHFADGKLGYLAPRSHDVIALEGDCPVASPKLNEALAAMRERLKDPKFPRFVKSMELFTNETEVQINVLDTGRPVAKWFFEWCESAAAIDYTTSLGTFRVSPHSFFQVNRFLVEKLVEVALGGVAGETALDLYAGVGLFAMPLSKRFANVTAVEGAGSAARDLAHNAAGALLVEHERVEDYLGRLKATPDLIVADPPRAGLGKAVVGHLNRLNPKQMVIVSCDPATLARDLAAMPNYSIERLTMVDLFPQTYHMETVVRLQRKA